MFNLCTFIIFSKQTLTIVHYILKKFLIVINLYIAALPCLVIINGIILMVLVILSSSLLF